MEPDTAAIPAEPATRFAADGATPAFEGVSSAMYAGHDAGSGARVLVKVLRAAAIASPDERRRIVREAQKLVTARHDELPAVVAAGESDGAVWLARAVFEGEAAPARLTAHGAMDPLDAARIGAKLASAIAELHKQRIVHRDVCTRHVLLGQGDRVVLLDAAVGRVFRNAAGRAVVGTPGYASPEAVAGRFVSSPSDLYGLGATLHELLTGVPPFGHGETLEVLARQAAGQRGELPEGTPVSLVELVDALMAAEPPKRPSSAMMVERRLQKIVADPGPLLERAAAPVAKPTEETQDEVEAPPTTIATGGSGFDPMPTQQVQAPPADEELDEPDEEPTDAALPSHVDDGETGSALSTAPYAALTTFEAADGEPARASAPTTIPGDVWGDLTGPGAHPAVAGAIEPVTDATLIAPVPRSPSEPPSAATGSMSMAAAQPPQRGHEGTLQWHPGPLERAAAMGPGSTVAFGELPPRPRRPSWVFLAAAGSALALLVLIGVLALSLRHGPATATAPAVGPAVAPHHVSQPVVAARPPPSPAPAADPRPAADEEAPSHHGPSSHHDDAHAIAAARRMLARRHYAAAEHALAGLASRQDANAEVHALRAAALAGQSQSQPAVDELREAVRLAPDNSDYLRRLARAQLGVGDRAAAIATLRHDLQANPRDSEARRLLQTTTRRRAPAHAASTHHATTSHATTHRRTSTHH